MNKSCPVFLVTTYWHHHFIEASLASIFSCLTHSKKWNMHVFQNVPFLKVNPVIMEIHTKWQVSVFMHELQLCFCWLFNSFKSQLNILCSSLENQCQNLQWCMADEEIIWESLQNMIGFGLYFQLTAMPKIVILYIVVDIQWQPRIVFWHC